jgi:hypothetical protein
MRAPDDGMTAEERKEFELEIFEFAREQLLELATEHGSFLEKFKFNDPDSERIAAESDGLKFGVMLVMEIRESADASKRRRWEDRIAEICSEGNDVLLRQLTKVFIEKEMIFPAPLREWAINNIDVPPPVPRGAPSRGWRNFFILLTISAIVRRCPLIKPTRTRARHGAGTPHSACSIVAMALQSLGANIDESAVEAIWRRRTK